MGVRRLGVGVAFRILDFLQVAEDFDFIVEILWNGLGQYLLMDPVFGHPAGHGEAPD